MSWDISREFRVTLEDKRNSVNKAMHFKAVSISHEWENITLNTGMGL